MCIGPNIRADITMLNLSNKVSLLFSHLKYFTITYTPQINQNAIGMLMTTILFVYL